MSKFNEEDDALLSELGVEVEVKKTGVYTKEEERIIAGFEEIQRFVEANGSAPQHGDNKDIFERVYAVRLDRLNELEECHQLLQSMDHQGVLDPQRNDGDGAVDDSMDDDELLASLGVDTEKDSIKELKNVRTYAERRAAENVGNRKACKDYDKYKPLIEAAASDIKNGSRETIPIKGSTSINSGDFFIINGQIAYVAELKDKFTNVYKRQNKDRDDDYRTDRRIKVIYNNGTESEVLLLSFRRAINDDSTSRKITDINLGPLFSDKKESGDIASGRIYVLRSNSDHTFISENRECIHKIGFTTGDIKKRLADAKNDATYLLADVGIVATYELYGIKAGKLEKLIHRFFEAARLDIELKDRFGKPYKPKEWFLIPLTVIKEAVDLFRDGILHQYKYDLKSASIMTVK
jgi:hypothetical protein